MMSEWIDPRVDRSLRCVLIFFESLLLYPMHFLLHFSLLPRQTHRTFEFVPTSQSPHNYREGKNVIRVMKVETRCD